VKRYTERLKTAYEHAWEIRAAYGFEVPVGTERKTGVAVKFFDSRRQSRQYRRALAESDIATG
jgi:hypothetical protein